MTDLYKEYYEVESREAQIAKWKELAAKGYAGSEIYEFNYMGIDDKFHYTICVFN